MELTLEAIRSGRSVVEGCALARVNGSDVSASDSVIVLVPARLDLTFASSAKKTTKVGDDVTFTATLWNLDPEPIEGIETELLGMEPADILSHVGGPTAADGSDPRAAPITLESGGKATIT